jgi:hypothetical protein
MSENAQVKGQKMHEGVEKPGKSIKIVEVLVKFERWYRFDCDLPTTEIRFVRFTRVANDKVEFAVLTTPDEPAVSKYTFIFLYPGDERNFQGVFKQKYSKMTYLASVAMGIENGPRLLLFKVVPKVEQSTKDLPDGTQDDLTK